MANQSDASFIDLIQAHERAWGTQSYPGRASLAELLSSPVILVWQMVNPDEKRQMFTAHQNLDEVDKYATRLILQSRQELPSRRLMTIYIHHKKATIRGVKVDINVPD
ncbi:MAG TPA: hypothetical protein VHL11_04410 [Phototrophicaceae bacterium]|nr:hypothetical protein [Phototrophicaceae bacterium]